MSRRCTMPARGSAGERGIVVQQRVHQGAGRIAGARVHDQAGGLVDHQQIGVLVEHVERGCPAARACVCISVRVRTLTASPPRTASLGRAGRPSSRASPDLIQAARREREKSGNSSASALSKRLPGVHGTVASGFRGEAVKIGFVRGRSWVGRLFWRPLAALGYHRRPTSRHRPASLLDDGPNAPFPLAPPARPRPARASCRLQPVQARQGRAAETLPVDQLYAEAKASLKAGNWRAPRVSTSAWSRASRTAPTPSSPSSNSPTRSTGRASGRGGCRRSTASSAPIPTHAHIDYAYYLRALINFDREIGLLERFCAPT